MLKTEYPRFEWLPCLSCGRPTPTWLANAQSPATIRCECDTTSFFESGVAKYIENAHLDPNVASTYDELIDNFGLILQHGEYDFSGGILDDL